MSLKSKVTRETTSLLLYWSEDLVLFFVEDKGGGYLCWCIGLVCVGNYMFFYGKWPLPCTDLANWCMCTITV